MNVNQTINIACTDLALGNHSIILLANSISMGANNVCLQVNVVHTLKAKKNGCYGE